MEHPPGVRLVQMFAAFVRIADERAVLGDHAAVGPQGSNHDDVVPGDTDQVALAVPRVAALAG